MARQRAKGKPVDDGELCQGGMSFGCINTPHSKGSFKDLNGKTVKTKVPNILCYRCNSRMGCSNCCQPPSELLCLHCHNWATKKGIKKHGNIVPNPKVPNVYTDQGWRKYSSTSPSMADLLPVIIDGLPTMTRLQYLELLTEMESKYPGVGFKQAADDLQKHYFDRNLPLNQKIPKIGAF